MVPGDGGLIMEVGSLDKSEWCGVNRTWASDLNREGGLIIG